VQCQTYSLLQYLSSHRTLLLFGSWLVPNDISLWQRHVCMGAWVCKQLYKKGYCAQIALLCFGMDCLRIYCTTCIQQISNKLNRWTLSLSITRQKDYCQSVTSQWVVQHPDHYITGQYTHLDPCECSVILGWVQKALSWSARCLVRRLACSFESVSVHNTRQLTDSRRQRHSCGISVTSMPI